MGCVWSAGRAEKYVHPPGTPLEKNRRKWRFLLGIGPVVPIWCLYLFGARRSQKSLKLPLPASEYPYFEYTTSRTIFMTP